MTAALVLTVCTLSKGYTSAKPKKYVYIAWKHHWTNHDIDYGWLTIHLLFYVSMIFDD